MLRVTGTLLAWAVVLYRHALMRALHLEHRKVYRHEDAVVALKNSLQCAEADLRTARIAFGEAGSALHEELERVRGL